MVSECVAIMEKEWKIKEKEVKLILFLYIYFIFLFSRMKQTLINNGQNKLVRKNSSCFNVIPFTCWSFVVVVLILVFWLVLVAFDFLYLFFFLSPLFYSWFLIIFLHTQNGWVWEKIRRNSTIHIHNSTNYIFLQSTLDIIYLILMKCWKDFSLLLLLACFILSLSLSRTTSIYSIYSRLMMGHDFYRSTTTTTTKKKWISLKFDELWMIFEWRCDTSIDRIVVIRKCFVPIVFKLSTKNTKIKLYEIVAFVIDTVY